MSGSWNEASFFKGNTFIEVASCYARTDLNSAQSFEVALRVTKDYVKSKIKKGKGELVAGPGGKLERLEIKYAWLGFQDLFYLTRLHLGLPISSLRLPPPTESTRKILLAANYPIREEDPILDENAGGETRRGRRLSVKDISRSRSRGGTAPSTPLYALSRVPSVGITDMADLTLDDREISSLRSRSIREDKTTVDGTQQDGVIDLGPGDSFYSVNGSQAIPPNQQQRQSHAQSRHGLHGLSYPSHSDHPTFASSPSSPASPQDPLPPLPTTLFTTPPRPAPSPNTHTRSSPITPTRQTKVYGSQPLRGRPATSDPFGIIGPPNPNSTRQPTLSLSHRDVYGASGTASGTSSTWHSTTPSPEMVISSEFEFMEPEIAQDPFARPPFPDVSHPTPLESLPTMHTQSKPRNRNDDPSSRTIPNQSKRHGVEVGNLNLGISQEDLRIIEQKQTELLKSLRQLRKMQEEGKREERMMRGQGGATPPPPYARSGWI